MRGKGFSEVEGTHTGKGVWGRGNTVLGMKERRLGAV